jgi:UDP-4-amino-4-deoxy-L-arabinose formyltransferase/UDP-glucuronic acid dehydrogenase (UDP-4-keto-hexauronic acid decarboxylating)
VDAKTYYGEGYQDVALRVPAIQRARAKLNWEPKTSMSDGLRKTLDFYLAE